MGRLQRYLDALGRIPTDEEVADALRMSRRGFFGACAGLVAAPYFAAPAGPAGHIYTDWVAPTCLRLLMPRLDVVHHFEVDFSAEYPVGDIVRASDAP